MPTSDDERICPFPCSCGGDGNHGTVLPNDLTLLERCDSAMVLLDEERHGRVYRVPAHEERTNAALRALRERLTTIQSFGEMRCACEFPCLSAENKSHDDGCPLYPHDRITESDIVRTIQGDDIDAKNELLRRLGRARLEASFQASDDAPELIEKWRPVVQRAFAIAVQDTNSEFVPSLSAQRVAQYILDGTKP